MTDSEKITFIENAIQLLFKSTVKVDPDADLFDLGLDSLDIVELQMYYEENTGHETDPEVTLSKVRDLMALMK